MIVSLYRDHRGMLLVTIPTPQTTAFQPLISCTSVPSLKSIDSHAVQPHELVGALAFFQPGTSKKHSWEFTKVRDPPYIRPPNSRIPLNKDPNKVPPSFGNLPFVFEVVGPKAVREGTVIVLSFREHVGFWA